MPHWKIKALIQGSLSRLPDAQRWNRQFQRYVTRSLTLEDDYLLSKWRQAARHVQHWRDHSGGCTPFSALELGTGWFPINPVGLALSGASTVTTVDREVLFQEQQVRDVILRFHDLVKAGRLRLEDSGGRRRLESGVEACGDPSLKAQDLLGAVGVNTRVGDARQLDLASDSVDLVCSNNTLEHIPPDVIGGLFTEFRRVLAPGGLMSHHIDLSDHYSHFDRSISVYNFLRYSEAEWRRYNNDLLFQNRLRLSDYERLHEETGWRVLCRESLRKPLEELAAVPVADTFVGYEPLDLAVYNTWMQSVPAVTKP